jgi:hypothetical protein
MTKRSYRNHLVELISKQTSSGDWFAQALIVVVDGKSEKRIPIFGRRRATFESRRRADAYAFELAKIWIDGRLWGANGRG